MKNKEKSTLLLAWSVSLMILGQLNAQKVLNTTNVTLRTDNYTLSYAIGEMAIKTLQGETGFLTQGVLQPIFALVPSGPLVTNAVGTACLGAAIEVGFSTVLEFNPDNVFTLELSDAGGSFSAPTIIAQINGTKVRNISVSLPNNLNPQDNFLVRVKSSSPFAEGYATNLVLRKRPKADFNIDNTICTGDTVIATFTGSDTLAGSNFIWTNRGSVSLEKAPKKYQQGFIWRSLTRSIKDTITLVVDNNGCKSDPVKKVVTIEPRMGEPKLSCSKVTGNAITFSWGKPTGTTSFRVIRLPYPDTVVKANFTSMSFTGLAPQTRIHLEIEAFGDGFCDFSRDTISCITTLCPKYQANLVQTQASICAGSSAKVELVLQGSPSNIGAYGVVYTANGGTPIMARLYAGEALSLNPVQTTTYNFLSVSNESNEGCISAFKNLIFQVNVAQNNSPGQVLAPILVCDNQDSHVILNDLLTGEDNNGQWSVPSGLNNPKGFDPDAGTFLPKGSSSGKYFFIYTVPPKTAGCSERQSAVEVNLERKLEVAIKDYSNCLDANGKTTVNLNTVALRVNNYAANQVRWFRDMAQKDTIKEAQLEVAAPLTIYAIVGKGKCGSTINAVTLKPGQVLPVPKIEGTSTFKVGEFIKLSTSSSFPPGSYFVWRTPDTTVAGTDIYQFPTRLATKAGEGRYSLQVRGPQEPGKPSCESEAGWLDVQIFNINEPALKIAKMVSANTPWKIEGLEAYPQHKIKVFNRWGQTVFEAQGTYSNNWTGTYNSKPLPQAAYYYQIETGEKEQVPILGVVYLIVVNH